jgi:MarR family transcriptional regulator, 2-MHQ and catechol-resistance regulon repressor
MELTDGKIQLNNLLIHFPIVYDHFTSLIFSQLGENFPRIYLGVLFLLKEHGPLQISHIGERLSVAKPNMTAIIVGLEDKGWILRSLSPEDRRVILIDLTESGSSYLEDVSQKLTDILNDRFSVLTIEEKGKMMESLSFLLSLGDKVLNQP